MISPIVALLTEIIPSPSVATLSPIVVGSNDDGVLGGDQNVSTQTELAAAQLNEGQDRRQLFVGYWDCVGTKSTKGIGEEPYHAHMHNLWTLQNVWLLIQFQEYQPTAGKPFAEDQYWGFSDNPVKHTRPMMTTGNGFGVVTSSGWEGDTSQWTGTYSVGEITFDLTETITILDHNKIQWGGKIILGGEVVGTYDLLCTRQNQGHNGNMPTA